MKLICPSCGAVHSAGAWMSDPDIRQCLLIVADLPRGISKRVFAYLSLFRAGARSLPWSKTLRLLSEINDMVKEGIIQWKTEPARPNIAQAWEIALEKIIERPPEQLPLKSHGYLRRIAYEAANELDKKNEQIRNQQLLLGPKTKKEDQPFSQLSLEQMKKIRSQNKLNNPNQ